MGSAITSLAKLDKYMQGLKFKSAECTFYMSFSRAMQEVYEGAPFIQQVFDYLAKVQDYVDKDRVFPVYRFGCEISRANSVVALNGKDGEFMVTGVENVYKETVRIYKQKPGALSGPTSIAPIIESMIEQCKQYQKEGDGKSPHLIAVILVNSESVTKQRDYQVLKEACKYPISFIFVSVFDTFESYDIFDNAIQMEFDNVHYTSIVNVIKKTKGSLDEFREKDIIAVIADMFQEIKAQH